MAYVIPVADHRNSVRGICTVVVAWLNTPRVALTLLAFSVVLHFATLAACVKSIPTSEPTDRLRHYRQTVDDLNRDIELVRARREQS